MIKTGSLISAILKPESKENNTFENFLGSKKVRDTTAQATKKNLIDIFNFDPLDSYYDQFIGDTTIFPKNLETFNLYITQSLHHTSSTLNSKGIKSIPGGKIEWFGSHKALLKFFNRKITNIANTLLLHTKEYDTISSVSFYTYIKENYPDLLGFISFEEISTLYVNSYKKFLKSLGKNEYGLDLEKVNKHLDHILYNNIGDGSFLYEWNTSKDNGINKYQRGVINPLYAPIKQKEDELYEYIFGRNGKNHSKIVKNILDERKSLVELGSGGIAKLEKALLYSFGVHDMQKFLKDKESIILTDVNSNGFVSIRQNLNKIIGNDTVEGTEVDIRNSNSNIYTTPKPIYFMFGGTIGNFTKPEIINLLNNMKPKRVLDNSYFVFTYFPAPDKSNLSPEQYDQEINKLKAMYGDDESNPFFNEEARNSKMDFVLSGFEALGLNRSNLKYLVEYEEASYEHPARIKLGAEFIEDENIITEHDVYSKKKGDKIWALQSNRFTNNEISNMAQSNGYDLQIQQDNDGVGVAILKSKTALNDKYKKIRNIGYSVAIAATLIGGYTGYHTYEKNKVAKQRIENHKKEYLYNHGIGIQAAPYYHELHNISEELSDRFIQYYGSGDLSKEEITKNISLYLEKFSAGQDRFTKLNKQDLYSADLFLNDFVDQYFYETMFKNGFDNLERKTVTKALTNQCINTLKYSGPMTEGYDKETNTVYVIHSPFKRLNDTMCGYAEGYMVPHKAEKRNFQIEDFKYRGFDHRFQYGPIDYFSNEELSKSRTPERILLSKDTIIDKQGEKSYLFKTLSVNYIRPKDIVDQYPKLLFKSTDHYPNTSESNQNHFISKDIQDRKLIVLPPKEIIALFEIEDIVFQRCRDMFIHSDAIDQNKLNENILLELKRLMILDLYPNGKEPVLSEKNINKAGMTSSIMFFIDAYIKGHPSIIKQIKDSDKDFPTSLLPQRQ